MIKVLHLSDIHMGSGFSHGKINPETGWNTRLEDFVRSLRLAIDRAIQYPVDLVLFGGDAFPNATPPPYVQEAFAEQFRRLADAQIPAILLVGNHDQYSQGSGGASLSIYRTLGVPGFIVGDRIATHTVTTQGGKLQVITLPWLLQSTLLTRPETEGLSLEEINRLLIERLEPILEREIRQLDPNLPTLLLGHLMADRASLGAERFLAVGKGFTLPLSLLIRPELDYVALGHIHKHQNLNPDNNPPVVYAGSIERVDFSEEKEDKGYVLIDLEKGDTEWEFCSLPARSFCTIELDLSESEDPQGEIFQAIAKYPIQEAVVRLIYKVRPEQLDQIQTRLIQDLLKPAHTYTIRPQLISQLSRSRLPQLNQEKSLSPLTALKTYLSHREDLQDILPELIDAAQGLFNEQLTMDN